MKTKNVVRVVIEQNETGAKVLANGVVCGWVCTWFNNTFAAVMNFGIRTRKDLAMPELNNSDKSHHGFTSKENAVLWLRDMISRYFAEYGYKTC